MAERLIITMLHTLGIAALPNKKSQTSKPLVIL